ncbi:MAG: ABC transporter substrate-binding protein [Gorillibacterium sp.]|nr:ABC transporter substrate-binding protein [Gorillibacterium sp.]
MIPLLLLTGMLAGCGSTESSGSSSETTSPLANVATSSAKTVVEASAKPEIDLSKVTINVGQTSWATYEKGFKEAGLLDTPYKIEFSVFQGGNLQMEAMAAGHLDLATSSEIPPIFAAQAQNGGNFKIIAVREGSTLQQELVIPKGSPIKSVADLKGKKVAYVGNTTAHYFLLKMLQTAGLGWKDIEAVNLTTSDGLTALVGGNVDALASYGNAIISAHQNGATTLASAKDILSGNFTLQATPAALQDAGKRAAIVDFLKRLDQFHEWTRNNQQKWAEITAENTHQPVETALNTLIEGETQRPSRVVPITLKAISSMQDVADTFNEVGLLKQKIDVSTFWSQELNEEIKKIGE